MIKNILVTGGMFGDRYSRGHSLGNSGKSLWKVKLKYDNYSGRLIDYDIIDCINCNITDAERDISKRLKWMTGEDFNHFLFDNGL